MRRALANPRSVCSLGLGSATSSANSGAPPPGYTSQRDINSPISVINEYEDYDGEVISNCPSSSPPPSTESHRDVLDHIYTLPSPYSTEDLPLVESTQPPVASHEQNQDPILSPHRSQAQSCPHGHRHTHSQRTPVSPFKAGFHSNLDVQNNTFPTTTNTPPVLSNSCYPPHQHQHGAKHVRGTPKFYGPPILSTDNLFGANVQSRSSYRLSPTEEHPPILQAANPHPHQHQQTTHDDYNPSSPYRQNMYGPPLADIRILTYPPAGEVAHEYDHDYEEYGYEDGEEDLNEGRSPSNDKNMRMMMTMMNSTATILSPSEEPPSFQSQDPAPLSPHRRRYPGLLNGVSHESITLGHRQAVTTTTTRDTVSPASRNLTKTATKFNSRNSTKPSAKNHSTLTLPPTQTQPTNYVHLSRKYSPSKPTSKFWGWRKIQPTQFPSKSSIAGTFTINPELNIPPELLDAMEDPVFRSSSSDTDNTGKTPQSGIGRTGSRRTNLRLEVENGGIDVDICLSPSILTDAMVAQVSGNATTTAFGGVGIPLSEKQTQQSPYPHLSTTVSPTTRMRKNPGQPSTKRKEAILKPAIAQRAPTRRDKTQSRPTTIHLQMKQAQNLNLPESGSEVKIKWSVGPIPFPLIARIHAPNPRPPFHLFASTIDVPNSIPDSTPIAPTELQFPTCEKGNQSCASSSTPNPMATSILNNETSGITLAMNAPCRMRQSLSKSHPQSVSSYRTFHPAPPPPTSSQLNFASPLYLHLPRTFHGPLTIHISSGDVGARLRLSEGLEREAALIRESEFGRGYFVGVLGSNVDVDGEKDEDRRGKRERDGVKEKLGDGGGDNDTIFIHPDENKARGTNNNPIYQQPLEQEHNCEPVKIENKIQLHNPNDDNTDHAALSDDSSVSSSLILLPSPPSPGKAEWYGDRIEIRVGSGDVYLQFEDEVDPFGTNLRREIGFWKRKLGCLGSLLN